MAGARWRRRIPRWKAVFVDLSATTDTQPAARALRSSKQALLDAGDDGLVPQIPPVEMNGITVPDVPDELAGRTSDGPVIGMFVIHPDGGIEPMGIDAELSAFWTPTAGQIAAYLLAWCRSNDLELVGDGYLTTSLSPNADISDGWHVDDDQIRPGDGIGVVAIASNGDGPVLLTQPVATDETRPGLPLDLDLDDAGSRPQHAVGPGTLAIFPQFGQVHRAPGPSEHSDFIRNLFVLRWTTAPADGSPVSGGPSSRGSRSRSARPARRRPASP